MWRRAAVVLFGCAIAGCYQSHARSAPDAGTVDAGTVDAGTVDVVGTCPPAAGLGAITHVEASAPGIVAYAGCDDACVLVYDGHGPPLDADQLERMRLELAPFHADESELGPCCPSRGDASGTCIIVRREREEIDDLCFPGMWVIGAAAALPGGRGCVGVRVEPID